MVIRSAQPYHQLADEFDRAIPFYATYGQRTIEALEPAPGTRLLDVAAGRGAIVRPAQERGCAVTAIDAAPAMVEHLRRDFPAADVHLMDAHDLALRDAQFDIVTAGFVINLLDEPAQALSEAHRVLAPGGTVAFTLPADGGEVGDWAFCNRLYAEFARYRPRDEMIVAQSVDAFRVLADVGFGDVVAVPLSVRIPVPDSAAGWEFLNTNGCGHFLDTLPVERREEFRERLDKSFAHRGGALTLEQTANLWIARRP